MSYVEIVQKAIQEHSLKPATVEQEKIIKEHLNRFPSIKYGIADDIVFILLSGKIYCRELPFVINGQLIEKRKGRYITTKAWANSQKSDIYSGIHIYIDNEETEFIRKEVGKRSKFKDIEHKNGDNADNAHRIDTGTLAEYAIEKLTGTKTTDFSQPSYNSQQFKEADNKELNFGVKACEDYVSVHYIERENTFPQILCTKINQENKHHTHIVCRGMATTQQLNDIRFWTRKTLIENGMLAKSIFFKTKIGFQTTQQDLQLFYNINQINNNPSNNKNYISKNILIDKSVHFGFLSEDFVKSFQNQIKDSDMRLVYVHTKSLGFQSFNTMVNEYEKTQSKTIENFEEFASKYKLGIIFYDDCTIRERTLNPNKKNYYNFENDTYLVAQIDINGNVTKWNTEEGRD